MDAIPLPFYEMAPLDEIARGVSGLRILFVNVFAISTPKGGWTLVDTGLYLSAGKIKHWAEEHCGGTGRSLASIRLAEAGLLA
jgi:hypothetical protein